MKIILENFGIIKKFEFETDDNFTFIIGKNNTGKSYAMTAVYSIIKNLSYFLEDFDELPDFIPSYEFLPEFEDAFIEFLGNNIKEVLDKGQFVENLDESLKNSFESLKNLQNKLSNQDLKIKIITNQMEFSIKFDNTFLFVDEVVVIRELIRINTDNNFIDSENIIKEMNLDLLLEINSFKNIYRKIIYK